LPNRLTQDERICSWGPADWPQPWLEAWHRVITQNILWTTLAGRRRTGKRPPARLLLPGGQQLRVRKVARRQIQTPSRLLFYRRCRGDKPLRGPVRSVPDGAFKATKIEMMLRMKAIVFVALAVRLPLKATDLAYWGRGKAEPRSGTRRRQDHVGRVFRRCATGADDFSNAV